MNTRRFQVSFVRTGVKIFDRHRIAWGHIECRKDQRERVIEIISRVNDCIEGSIDSFVEPGRFRVTARGVEVLTGSNG